MALDARFDCELFRDCTLAIGDVEKSPTTDLHHGDQTQPLPGTPGSQAWTGCRIRKQSFESGIRAVKAGRREVGAQVVIDRGHDSGARVRYIGLRSWFRHTHDVACQSAASGTRQRSGILREFPKSFGLHAPSNLHRLFAQGQSSLSLGAAEARGRRRDALLDFPS